MKVYQAHTAFLQNNPHGTLFTSSNMGAESSLRAQSPRYQVQSNCQDIFTTLVHSQQRTAVIGFQFNYCFDVHAHTLPSHCWVSN
jgi:hypothetical protein